MRLSWPILVALALVLAGCGGSDNDAEKASEVPPPPIAKLLPRDYRAEEVLKANLTGGPVPETVVTSVGPPAGELGLHPATLQVLSWDALAKRWTVLFDAQKVTAPETYGDPRTSNGGPGVYSGVSQDPRPLLDSEADVRFELVDSARLLKGDRDQLVFAATLHYGGSGVPQTLVVADFEDAKAEVLYAWYGEHLDVELKDDRIVARSSYWTHGDSHCCPLRGYRFVVGNAAGKITVLEDERPYLGVLVREQGESLGEEPLTVLNVAKGSPADGELRAGDVLLDVQNTPPLQDAGRPTLTKKVSAFDAGQTARLVLRRNGAEMTVPVKLGSLKDAQTMPLPEDEDDRVEAL